jgi:hypothetical protein
MTASRGAYYRLVGPEGEVLQPLASAAGHWGADQMRGPAVTSALARAAERAVDDRPELRPARATFELFRPARLSPVTTRAEVVRHGRRLALVDSVLLQDDVPVARANVLFLAGSPLHESLTWTPEVRWEPPPHDLAPDHNGHLYASGGGAWTSAAGDHDNAGRKRLWHVPGPVVDGERPTAFQSAAEAGDFTNMVINWGVGGVQYINADVTISMSRLPEEGGIGIAASQRVAQAGIAVGTACLFDRSGVFGSAAVSSLGEAGRAVSVSAALRP